MHFARSIVSPHCNGHEDGQMTLDNFVHCESVPRGFFSHKLPHAVGEALSALMQPGRVRGTVRHVLTPVLFCDSTHNRNVHPSLINRQGLPKLGQAGLCSLDLDHGQDQCRARGVPIMVLQSYNSFPRGIWNMPLRPWALITTRRLETLIADPDSTKSPAWSLDRDCVKLRGNDQQAKRSRRSYS